MMSVCYGVRGLISNNTIRLTAHAFRAATCASQRAAAGEVCELQTLSCCQMASDDASRRLQTNVTVMQA